MANSGESRTSNFANALLAREADPPACTARNVIGTVPRATV